MYMSKWKNGREDFEKFNFEAEWEHWCEKLLRLAI